MSWKQYATLAVLIGVVGCSDDPVVLNAPFVEVAWTASSVTLTWQAVVDAETYDVYRGTEVTNLALYDTDLAATQYQDVDAVSGTVYYYAVNAKKGDVDSGLSLSVAAFPHTAPIASGKVYENTSSNGSYYGFFMNNGVAGGEDFTQAQVVQGADADLGLNTHDGGNEVDPELRSPHFTAGTRNSSFVLVQENATQADFDALISASEAGYSWVQDGVSVLPQALYLVRTEEGNFAKLWITSGAGTSPFAGSGSDEYVEFRFDYNPNGVILF
jgi:hypothetical protein